MAINPRAKLLALVGAGVMVTLYHFVPRQEGEVRHAYFDSARIVTACDGHTGPELKIGQTFSAEDCQAMLTADLTIAAAAVRGCVYEPLSDGELAADVSFTFNVGGDAFCGSTLVRKLNAGDHAGACAELSRWIKADGHVLAGLVRRRAAERALCEGKT